MWKILDLLHIKHAIEKYLHLYTKHFISNCRSIIHVVYPIDSYYHVYFQYKFIIDSMNRLCSIDFAQG